jgi:chaperonin GroEL
VVEAVKKEKTNMGYNVDTEEMVDMFSAGVIDPTKVARSAVENAGSVASLLFTTEALITERAEKKKSPDPGQQGFGRGDHQSVASQR